MPKELTHILIAQDVVKQLKQSGQQLLARVIKGNLSAFYLGAIIPDAFYYDVIRLRKTPQISIQMARTLHSKDTLKNDQKAVSFFDHIGADPHIWPLTLAFASGIVTHTVSDRIIHGIIEHYTTNWGQKGSAAIASHRQFETLIDMALLQQSRQHPREFGLERLTAIDQPSQDRLFRLYLGHLIGDNSSVPICLLKTLKRAHAQQHLFLKLFTSQPLYHIMNRSNKLLASCLEVWSALFYPDTVGTQTFPILHKIDLNALTDGRYFTGTLASLVDEVITEAIRQINVGVRRLST